MKGRNAHFLELTVRIPCKMAFYSIIIIIILIYKDFGVTICASVGNVQRLISDVW